MRFSFCQLLPLRLCDVLYTVGLFPMTQSLAYCLSGCFSDGEKSSGCCFLFTMAFTHLFLVPDFIDHSLMLFLKCTFLVDSTSSVPHIVTCAHIQSHKHSREDILNVTGSVLFHCVLEIIPFFFLYVELSRRTAREAGEHSTYGWRLCRRAVWE